ncbi:MAG: hypothetical protein CMJ58_12400 [Planctomycetaceae bacterium]|nr:hypothetical protein [Planctomycetaceae bacterium]
MSPQVSRENPQVGPHQFEGFEPFDEAMRSVDVSTVARGKHDVAVVRAGENAYGTWGYIGVRKNESEFEFKGYTLEPRSSVGKGPIPLGRFSFRKWVSAKLGKTLRLSNVPGFTDILVHVGNTQGDTQGCILAGKEVDSLQNPTRLKNSRVLTDWLHDNCPSGMIYVASA